MKRFIPIAAALLLGAGAAAAQVQPPADGAEAGRRISHVIIYGNDPCPRSTDENIVVCARRPENDRFRIPEFLRERPSSSENESWAAGAQQLEMVGRTGIQSCSAVGPGGSTGCWSEMVRRWRDNRRNPETNAAVPTP